VGPIFSYGGWHLECHSLFSATGVGFAARADFSAIGVGFVQSASALVRPELALVRLESALCDQSRLWATGVGFGATRVGFAARADFSTTGDGSGATGVSFVRTEPPLVLPEVALCDCATGAGFATGEALMQLESALCNRNRF
jgi:hypothetical protein